MTETPCTIGNATRALSEAPFLGGSGAAARLAAAIRAEPIDQAIALSGAVIEACEALNLAAQMLSQARDEANKLAELKRAVRTITETLDL